MKDKFKPFNMNRKPSKQYPILMPLVWIGSFLLTRQFNLKIEKENMKGLKTPYLVIASHQGFSDYYIGPLAMFPHRAMYISDMEGFAAFGLWLYRGLGCIGKRRYVPEINVLRHMKYAFSKKQSVFVYPESRHSNVGTTAKLPKNLGRLCKFADVPIVLLREHGSYLANPFWDEEHTRKVPIKAKMKCIYTREELRKASAEEIQNNIENLLQYNEYQYQKDNNIKINYKKRAEGLHKALYQCISCGSKYEMSSSGHKLTCNYCNKVFEMTELGELCSDGNYYSIPDWYNWEEEKIKNELAITNNNEQTIIKKFNVSVELLFNENGFVCAGSGILQLNFKEFILTYNEKTIRFPHINRESVQTEYNYKGKGMCIVLSTSDCCYYIYSNDKDFNPTEIQFIGEYLYAK